MKNIVTILLFSCFVFSAKTQVFTVEDIQISFEVDSNRPNLLATATVNVTQDTIFGFDYNSLDSNKSFFVKIGSQKTELNGSGTFTTPVHAGESIKIKMDRGINSGTISNLKPSFEGQFEPAKWYLGYRHEPTLWFVNLPLGTNGFCPYSIARNNFEWIEEVSFGDETNKTGKDEDGHGIYKSFPVTFFYNDTALVQLSPGYKSRVYTEYWRIWIDLNQDDDYMDEGEMIFEKSGKNMVSENIVFTDNINSGIYNMKVAMSWKAFPPACGSYVNGEYEEYTVLIRPPE